MSIGIFDSGLGGLTVARAVMEALQSAKIVYFGDTARGPYGNKRPSLVRAWAIEDAQFLLRKKVKAMVVGCNTASAAATAELRRTFPGVPLFDVITPAVREALHLSRNGKIGVIGTRTTIESGAYERWLPRCLGRACPLFVPLVEAGYHEHPATEEVARAYLDPLKRAGVDTLILGCTHYPFLKTLIAKIMGPEVALVDSAQTVAKEVAAFITPPTSPYLKGRNGRSDAPLKVRGARGVMKPPTHEFYVSKKTPRFQELAEQWLGQKITLKLAKI